MTSIRRTLTTRLLLTLGLLMAIAGVLLYLGVRAALTASFDDTLRGRLVMLQSAARWDGQRVDLDFAGEAMPWYRPGIQAEYFEIRTVLPDGAPAVTVTKSPSLSDAALPSPTDDAPADITLPSGSPGRIARLLFTPTTEEDLDAPGKETAKRQALASAPRLQAVVAIRRHELDETLRTIAAALALAGLALAVGLIVTVRNSLNRGLAPLANLSDQVRAIEPENLAARMHSDGLPAELSPITQRLNDLLARLESAFARERRFAAAAAHELRTPVAELRTLLEVSLSRPRSTDDARAAAAEALDITLRMESLVQTLLALTRPADPSVAPAHPPILLAPILNRLAESLDPAARRRAGAVTIDCHEHLAAAADPAALQSVLRNLLSNAVEYAAPAPVVSCRAGRADDNTIFIDIRNPVSDLTPDQVGRFFEPFWRASPSRTDHSHLGLGLIVARALAEGMRGSLTIDLIDRAAISARLTLPAA